MRMQKQVVEVRKWLLRRLCREKKARQGRSRSVYSIEDAWREVVARSPRLWSVDERAEEFIYKFREEIKLQKDKSIFEFEERQRIPEAEISERLENYMYRNPSSQDVRTLFFKTCTELRNRGSTQFHPSISRLQQPADQRQNELNLSAD
ncbi:hypothetical protein SADUNF_Sadunf10G0037800 [Salix dunnii]|uniref:Uncharacterized protein n=1 Tax=Salix dunnii TaxID=1413687 RepID=A0A835JUX9_9ROSI|nr:hypothetical protein SADUNF_Sadunf10G0037800 [Salix dunnii]